MPTYFRKTYRNKVELLVWQITETEDELQRNLSSNFKLKEIISSDAKRIESLAARNAISTLGNELGLSLNGIKKDQHGKPHLIGANWQLSITHTADFVAVVMHPNLLLGIDLELPQKKILKVIPRLFNEEEQAFVGEDINKACIYWSGKECLYKLYGKRGVLFKENLSLMVNEKGLVGKIDMPDYTQEHSFYMENIGKFFLLIAF